MADDDEGRLAKACEELGITEEELWAEAEEQVNDNLDLVADVVQYFWQALAPEDTGNYKDSFVIREITDENGHPARRVTNVSEYAHIIEYGSADMPEMSPRARTATHFNNEGKYTV